MTRNSPSIPGGNLDAVTFPSIHSVPLRDCDCGDAEECDCPFDPGPPSDLLNVCPQCGAENGNHHELCLG